MTRQKGKPQGKGKGQLTLKERKKTEITSKGRDERGRSRLTLKERERTVNTSKGRDEIYDLNKRFVMTTRRYVCVSVSTRGDEMFDREVGNDRRMNDDSERREIIKFYHYFVRIMT